MASGSQRNADDDNDTGMRCRYDSHGSHLAHRAALKATLRGNIRSKVADNLPQQNAEKLAATLDPNFTADRAAADLATGEMAELQ